MSNCLKSLTCLLNKEAEYIIQRINYVNAQEAQENPSLTVAEPHPFSGGFRKVALWCAHQREGGVFGLLTSSQRFGAAPIN